MVLVISGIYFDLGRLIIQIVLSALFISLVVSLRAQYRDLRLFEERHKNHYGCEYCDGPSQMKKAFIKCLCFFRGCICLAGKSDKQGS
jgi:hypothetical protein